MLNSSTNHKRITRSTVALTMVVFFVTALSIAGLRASIEESAAAEGSAIVPVVQDALAIVTGSVYDLSGAIFPGVEMTLESDNEARFEYETTSTLTGSYRLEGIPAGDYVLRASQPGFRTLRHNLTLEAGQNLHQDVTLALGGVLTTLRVSADTAVDLSSASTPVQALRVGGRVEEGIIISRPQPEYPEHLRAAGIGGTVQIEGFIGSDGEFRVIRALTSPVHPDLVRAALDAVGQWRYEPYRLNGDPIDLHSIVTVDFRISE